jgi:hypothetical protein
MTKEQLERLKLLQETGLRGYAVTVASILFGLASIAVAVVTTATGLAKDNRDHAVACANLAVSLTGVISSTEAAIKGKSPPDVASYLKEVSSVLPPDLAAGFYKTFQPKLKTADALMDSELANLAKDKSKLRLTDCGIE